MTTPLFSIFRILTVVQVSVFAVGIAVAQTPPGQSQPGQVTGKTITLTLEQVVSIAVANNTNVVLARQRLSEAGEGVKQIDAQGKPQLNSDVADTYSTFPESSVAFGPVVENPVVPTGTTIPIVTDQAADFSSAFGLGSAGSSSASFGAAYGSPLGVSGTAAPIADTTPTGSAGNAALPGATTSPSSTATGVTAEPGAGESPAPSTGPTSSTNSGTTTTTAPATTAVPGATVSPTSAAINLMPLPLILQNYVTEPSAPQVVADVVQPATVKSADVTEPKTTTAASSIKSAETARAEQSSETSSNTTTGSQSIVNDTVNNYGARINLSQYVDAFGLLRAARDAEKLNRQFYEVDIDRTQNEVALSAKNLFFNVILAEQQVATEQEQVADSTESVRVTNALVQQGQAAGFDLLSAQTTLANNQQLLTSATNQLSFAVADLDYLLGINPSTPVNLVAPPLPPLNQTVDLTQSTNVALQRRPEIIQADSNIAMAEKLVKVASEGLTPSIGLVGTYGYNSTSTDTTPTNEGLFSAQVAIPFDDGGATKSRVREARDILQGQVTTRDELKLSVALEVRQAYLNVLDGQAQATTAQTGVNLAVETLRVANVQYNNGVGTILDVENAQAQLATARTNLANAQFTYQTALASLVRDIGSR